MKILFLDFDGVLNSQKWLIANKEAIINGSGLTWRGAAELDPIGVRRVLSIIEATGAAVVISSSWRIIHEMEEIKEIFKLAGFPEMGQHIIDKTPFERFEHVLRGNEIQDWIIQFESKNGQLTSFCILDDDSDMLPRQRPNFVQTTWQDGIQEEHVQRAIKILGVSNVPV